MRFLKGWLRAAPGLMAGAFCLLGAMGGLAAETRPELVLNHPDFPVFHANALDQPRLDVVLTRNGEVVEDLRVNPWSGEEEMAPAVIRAFIDTGASGFTISHLHKEPNEYDKPSLHFSPGEFRGEYTNLGIGGEEVGDVFGEFGFRIRNGPTDPFGMSGEFIEEFVPYEDDYRLWLRRAPGIGEVNEVDLGGGMTYQLVSPVNIIGMPVIEQRVMVMNWERNEFLEEMFPNIRELHTFLLDRGDAAIPETNITLSLKMKDFVGEPAAGEVNPTTSRNPLVQDIRITHDPERDIVVGDWLFDTGAGASFISFQWAQSIGMIPEEFADLNAYVIEHQAAGGIISQIGGIGPDTVTVPVLELNEIRIPAREGFDLVWENVRVLVFEHPELAELGLEGIFGMNLIGPSVTIDAAIFDDVKPTDTDRLLEAFDDISPAPFSSMVFEVTGEETAELRLFTDRINSGRSYEAWIEEHFGNDATNDDVSGVNADPGGYGIPNLLRYAFGMDARNPQRERMPRIVYGDGEGEGGSGLSIWFDRSNNALDIDFKVDVSENLEDWNEVEAEWHVRETFSDRERVEVVVPRSAPDAARDFFRIRVVKE